MLYVNCGDGHGTKENQQDPSYVVKKINNINIGIINYTYETSPENPTAGVKYLNGKYQYTIYPLENPNDLGKYAFNSTELGKAKASYERTKTIVAEGLRACQESIGCDITFN